MQKNHFTLFQFYSYHYSIRLESKEELHFLHLSRWKTPLWSEKIHHASSCLHLALCMEVLLTAVLTAVDYPQYQNTKLFLLQLHL